MTVGPLIDSAAVTASWFTAMSADYVVIYEQGLTSWGAVGACPARACRRRGWSQHRRASLRTGNRRHVALDLRASVEHGADQLQIDASTALDRRDR